MVGKIAWILGAGFSKPLGGPLLNEVFDEAKLREVIHVLDVAKLDVFGGRFRALLDVYSEFKANLPRQIRSGSPWADPEAFLDRLERAAADGARHSVRNRDGRVLEARELDVSRQDARAFMALACDHWLPDKDAHLDDDERWRPYLHWAQRLVGNDDTIITFNYDRVVERAFAASHRSLTVRLPGRQGDPRPESPVLLKLHGSTDWQAADGRGVLAAAEIEPLETVKNNKWFLLGIPGPAKYASTKAWPELWSSAEEAIRRAEVVVIIGYRFAATDDEAKRRLLGALRSNDNPRLTVRIVLGPDTSGEHVRRVEGLIRWTMDGTRVTARPSDHPRRGYTPEKLARENLSSGLPFILDPVPLYAQDLFIVASHRTFLGHWLIA